MRKYSTLKELPSFSLSPTFLFYIYCQRGPMKTHFDIPLIEKIVKNPQETIGQRSYRLFNAYCLSHYYYLRTVSNQKELEKYCGSIPSIDEYIESIYNIRLGSRNWTTPLMYESEDERDLFDKAINVIFEYEKKFPTPDGLKSKYHVANDCDLMGLIGHIGYRPAMYFGTLGLDTLRAFIDGYFAIKEAHQISFSPFEKSLIMFIAPFKKREDLAKYRTWDRLYNWKYELTVFGTNEKHSIPRFLYRFEQFAGIKINPIVKGEEKQIDWNDHNR